MKSLENWENDEGCDPVLELRVGGVEGAAGRATVVEHLTIGRSAASGLVIDGPGVNMIHARVVVGECGLPEVRGVGPGRMTLADGAQVDRVDLRNGVKFGVGGVTVECVRVGWRDTGWAWWAARAPARPTRGLSSSGVMGAEWEEEGDGGQSAPEGAWVPSAAAGAAAGAASAAGASGAAGAGVEMPRLVACPTCYRDVTGVPVVARFCPKCGARLPARDAAGYLIPPEESSPLFPVYWTVRHELEEKLSGERPAVAHSLIMLAYANAMLNLGWRYEHGRGGMKNVEEAARCYAKAGRLVGRAEG
jgi:hypothetical protein